MGGLECTGEEISYCDILWTSCDLRRGRCNTGGFKLYSCVSPQAVCELGQRLLCT
jgi:hypothetical protein